jgi:hypothetical protein
MAGRPPPPAVLPFPPLPPEGSPDSPASPASPLLSELPELEQPATMSIADTINQRKMVAPAKPTPVRAIV